MGAREVKGRMERKEAGPHALRREKQVLFLDRVAQGIVYYESGQRRKAGSAAVPFAAECSYLTFLTLKQH